MDFDGQVVRRELRLKALMDQFVCVRMVQANAMDLNLFQFDYDLTFAAFFMNADKTVYGRYGSRSDRSAVRDISMQGFGDAMEGALEIHRGYPANRETLAGKQGHKSRYERPEQYPSLSGFKADIDYLGQVARSCMHCHQISDAERMVYRNQKESFPLKVLFPWPMPATIGMKMDADKRATVKTVSENSPASAAGLNAGDAILSLNGQPILSTADIQWVLHHSEDIDQLKAVVRSADKERELTLSLAAGWRTKGDITWRTSTWDLRRMVGGVLLKDLTDEEREQAGIGTAGLALKVEHLGQHGQHGAAFRVGFRKNDIFTAYDGRKDRATETEFLMYSLDAMKPGMKMPVTVLREQKEMNLMLPIQ